MWTRNRWTIRESSGTRADSRGAVATTCLLSGRRGYRNPEEMCGWLAWRETVALEQDIVSKSKSWNKYSDPLLFRLLKGLLIDQPQLTKIQVSFWDKRRVQKYRRDLKKSMKENNINPQGNNKSMLSFFSNMKFPF